MKFEFPFEVLLDHKRKLEDAARREWVEAQRKVDEAAEKLKSFYDQIDESRKRAGSLEVQGGAQAPSLVAIDEFIKGQAYRIDNQRRIVRELMSIAEGLQEALLAAAQETKTLEKLKEKQFEQFKLKRKKMELKETDELVVSRHKRGNGFGEVG